MAKSKTLKRTPTLEVIAKEIHEALATLAEKDADVWETRMRIATRLAQARQALPGDREFGRWTKLQGFDISRATLYNLRRIGERPERARLESARFHEAGKTEIGIRTLAEAVPLPPEARKQFPANQEFGRWFTAQEFGFGLRQALDYRHFALHTSEVLKLLPSRDASRDGGAAGCLCL